MQAVTNAKLKIISLRQKLGNYIMEATNKATTYAENKSSQMFINAIKEAYIDGYCAGYKDRELNFEKEKVGYIDLGLPSGTLWSSDYLKENDEIKYLSHDEAVKYDIPSIEQWKELRLNCEVLVKGEICILVGPNGNYIEFTSAGCYIADVFRHENLLWSDGKTDENIASCVGWRFVYSNYHPTECCIEFKTVFKGKKLPVRLVK